MLKLDTATRQSPRVTEQGANFLPQLDLLSILRLFSRHWPRFVLVASAVLTLALVYQLTAKRRYSTTFSLLVSVKDRDILATNADTGSTDKIVDPGAIESEVEVVKSSQVLLEAVRKLNLTQNEEFMNAGATPVTRFISWVVSKFNPAEGPPSQAKLEEDAVEDMANTLKVKRVGVTYVVEATYTGPDPELTLSIANAISTAYLNSALKARYDSSRRAADWFRDRLLELRKNVSNADLSVQQYKISNDIVDTSKGLIIESQLSDVTSQLSAAQATTAEAKARLDGVMDVLNGDVVNAAVSDSMKSDVITRLRAQYLDLSSKQAEMIQRYGKDHQIVRDLGRQMGAIAASAKEELKRIAQADRSDYEIALDREKSLNQSMKQLISQLGESNESQVALRNLESSAQAYRNMYDTFLQKFQQTAAEQTVPLDTARLITPPALPQHPSWPRALIVTGGGLIGAGLLGFIVIVLTEMFGNGFKSPDDVRNYAGLECFGTLPRLSRGQTRRLKRALDNEHRSILGQTFPLARQTVLEPFSRFTETIRNAKVSIDLEHKSDGAPVIGIVSALPKEGKTTLTANLALLTAQMGHKTLVIDGDFHTCSLTKTLAPDAGQGILEALEHSGLEDFVLTDPITGLHFLPAVIKKRLTNAAEVLKSKQMSALLDEARDKYEYVYVDLPPLLPVVDAKASVYLFDSFVYVIDWENTSRDVVRDALMVSEFVRQKIVGVVLNKANPGQLRRIESYKGPSYDSYYVKSNLA